ncbi:hypothetical protein DQ237_15455 [Blastococcus sp. TF02-8]|uniref:hypothetical protein n=1 Tax=Blastococcus sp. TF02-8 TaxID=2250574 RepID=UPI000DEAD5F3|nr:hypothetical protein [Blastococcus sp. TF02-8]RBY95212.1 hypothetical protein DQ237_15455 [Blastococcus sp. TF02-8]
MLLAALVVLWFVVLVPMVVTRGDADGGRVETADAGRTLQRRRSAETVRRAETERVEIDRDVLRTTGELKVDVHALRRRALGGLVLATLASLVGSLLLTPWLWIATGVFGLATVGYVLVLRKVARRERMAARRAARVAAREAMRTRTTARPVATPVQRTAPPAEVFETVAQQGLPAIPHSSVPLAPVHALRPGRVVAARTPAPVGWQNSAVVGLDDDDIGFADIDEYRPARVANA